MTTATKAELAAQVKRLQSSLNRAETKIAALDTSLGRANAKIKTLSKSLADALERGRATAEILNLISRSPTDSQPVFDAIAATAFRLVGDVGAVVTRIVGDELHLAAFTSTSTAGDDALKRRFPLPISDNPCASNSIAQTVLHQ